MSAHGARDEQGIRVTLLITGGTGFLGSYLASHVAEEHPSERVVVLEKFPVPARISGVLDRVTVVEGDVTDLGTVETVVRRHHVERVAHLAFVLGGPAPGTVPAYTAVQCQGTANVLEAARRAGVSRVLFASSVAIYGPQAAAVLTEDLLVNPVGLYASAKAWGESVARHYSDEHGLDTVVLRYGSTYGLGRASRGSYASGLTGVPATVHYMARVEDAARGKDVVMPTDDAEADWLYAGDAARAAWLALTAAKLSHRVYNVGSERRPVGDFTNALRRALPGVTITSSAEELPGHAHAAMDFSRLRHDLGFRPRYDFDEGIGDYIRRVRAHDSYVTQAAAGTGTSRPAGKEPV